MAIKDLLIIAIPIVCTILVGVITNKIDVALSRSMAIIIVAVLSLIIINFTLVTNTSTNLATFPTFLASGSTVINGIMLGFIIFQNTQEKKKIAEERTQLAEAQAIFMAQRKAVLSQLRIGLLPIGTRLDPQKQDILRNYLSKKLNIKDVTIGTVGPNHEDLMNAVVNGHIEVAYFGPLLYLHTIKEHPEIKPILFMPPDNPKQNYYYSYIITRSDAGITSLEGIRGKQILFGHPWSASGTLYPKYFLKNAGIDNVKGTYNSSQAQIIETILNSQDILIGAISSFAYYSYKNNLKVGQNSNIRILNESESKNHPILPGPIVLRAGIQEYDILRIKEAYLSINDPAMLNTLGTAKFTSLTSEEAKEAYQPIADIASSLGVVL